VGFFLSPLEKSIVKDRLNSVHLTQIKVMKLPMSPYETRQEQFRDYPFRMMVICFMLNQTHHRQVDAISDAFFARCPDAQSLLDCPDEDMIEIIKPLGFYNRRTKQWKKFAQQWLEATDKYGGENNIPVQEIEKMKGVGKYALDSWKIFMLYDYEVQPEDHVLNWYVLWAREQKKKILRDLGTMKPYSVYYAHYRDERFADPNWMRCKDYACVVRARTQEEAIEKTKTIAMNQPEAKHIKILGIGFAREEWVDENRWMETDPDYYREQAQLLKQRMESRRQQETK